MTTTSASMTSSLACASSAAISSGERLAAMTLRMIFATVDATNASFAARSSASLTAFGLRPRFFCFFAPPRRASSSTSSSRIKGTPRPGAGAMLVDSGLMPYLSAHDAGGGGGIKP